jgi:two-component system OmpR family sensor kinase
MGLPRSLTNRLVLTAVGLVALVSILIAVATTIAMRDYLTDQLDDKVIGSTDRAGRGPGAMPPGMGEPEFGNQEPGTIVVLTDDDLGFVVADRRGDEKPLSDAAVDVLSDLPRDEHAHEVDLPGYGSYRVAVDEEAGVVTGLPTEDVDDAVRSLVRWELALGALAAILAGVAGNIVVRRQLRPLSDVAATAHAVADQPLDTGTVELARVPEHLTDPDTEVGQVGQALNTLLAHVESSLDARNRSEQQVRQFVADASHELRTPLTTIVGYTELARTRQDPEATATALAKVEEEAARMTALVEDLLLLARLDSGRPLAQEPVDLTRLLLEAVTDARVLAPDHHWHLELPRDAVPVEVTGDEARLHQVVSNLLTNARKYTPAGTTVTVAVQGDGFEVRDDGPGFPPDLLPVAFERFSRADASRHREGGIGLGLALVQAIVTAHGGTVTLTSEPGDTRVRVLFGLSDNP